MCFAFKPAHVIWRNQLLQARLQTVMPLFHEIQPHWWLAKPIQTSLPKLVFSVNKRAPLLDNYRADWSFDLYSERLVDLISEEDVAFETFPAEIIDYKTSEIIHKPYYVFHLLEKYPCADIDTSKEGSLILTEQCVQAGYPLFRVAEGIQIVLIHERLKAKLEKAQITGCEYELPSHYRNVPLFPPREFEI